MKWALDRRRKQPESQPACPLFLNGRGERFDKPTQSGNRNQQIPNQFAPLPKTDSNELARNARFVLWEIRKTAADLIRRLSDGEVPGVFLCHGQPVRTDNLADVYTNRPFGKVFATLRKVEEHLKQVFEAAGAVSISMLVPTAPPCDPIGENPREQDFLNAEIHEDSHSNSGRGSPPIVRGSDNR